MVFINCNYFLLKLFTLWKFIFRFICKLFIFNGLRLLSKTAKFRSVYRLHCRGIFLCSFCLSSFFHFFLYIFLSFFLSTFYLSIFFLGIWIIIDIYSLRININIYNNEYRGIHKGDFSRRYRLPSIRLGIGLLHICRSEHSNSLSLAGM